MKLFELQIEFFEPMWRRVLLVIVCFGWSLVEFSNEAWFWGILFVAIGVYAIWQFFFDGWPATQTGDGD